MEGSKTGRPGLLWVCRDQPSRLGTGSQQRAAHVLLALADHFDLHVVLLPVWQSLRGVRDRELFDRFASFEQIATRGPDAVPKRVPVEGPAIEAAADGVPALLVEMARRRGVDATLIVTFELAVLLRPVLDRLPPVYLELDELMSQRQQRFLATPGLPQAQRDEFRRGLRLMSILEQQVLPRFRGVIVSSALEASHLRGRVPEESVSVVPNATHRDAVLPPPPPAPRAILFVGRMDYFPNLDAASYFLSEVWPGLRARYADELRLHLVGFGAPPSFEPEKVAGVVFDRNRSDMLPAYRGATIAVVPIRSGGGTRIKILEAFALGRPVVSTSMGAEGLDVQHGRHLLIADSPEAFAAACADLLDDPYKAARLTAEAAAWVQKYHSPAAVRAAVAGSVLVRADLQKRGHGSGVSPGLRRQ